MTDTPLRVVKIWLSAFQSTIHIVCAYLKTGDCEVKWVEEQEDKTAVLKTYQGLEEWKMLERNHQCFVRRVKVPTSLKALHHRML
jgi:hypothetical protein